MAISKKPTHIHRMEPLHSVAQARMFFVLVAELKADANTAKERATKKFNHGCFNDLTSEEINWCIDSLQQRIWMNQKKQNQTAK